MAIPSNYQAFCEKWFPVLYKAEDISNLLGLDLATVKTWLKMINGDAHHLWVTHHDLVEFIKDHYGPSNVPTSRQDLPEQGLWLVEERGWFFDNRYSKYRWVDPETNLNHTLRTALQIELFRCQFRNSSGVIDVELLRVEPTATETNSS